MASQRNYKDLEDADEDFYASGNVRDDEMLGHNGGPELTHDDGIDTAAYNAKLEELLKLSPEELIQRADKRLLATLVASMESGYASHQELAILNTYLKNKGMVFPPAGGDQNGQASRNPQDTKAPLPSFSTPEYDSEDNRG